MSAPAPQVLYTAESPAAWAARPPAVVDCSVMAALLWGEAAAADAARALGDRALHAPALLPYELANVARNKHRSGVPLSDALAGLTALDEQRVALHDIDAVALATVAANSGLSAYDAAYLWLARALDAPLLTFDRKLAEAAARCLGQADPP